MNRDQLKHKRDRAIQMLRDTGMSDAEIEAELGHSISEDEPIEIVDAEIVSEDELSRSQAVEDGPRHLPAVIPAPPSESTAKTGRDWSKSSVPERRCKAHRKNGEQCKNAAILGSTVCRYHGGASKHVKMAARARLENATDLMAKQLLGMATDPDVNDAVKLSAIKDALDRGGLKAPNEVVLSASTQSGFDEMFDEILTGPREDSRRARGIEDTGSIEVDSFTVPTDYPTAPGDVGPSDRDDGHAQRDCDRPAATHSDEPPCRDTSHRPEHHITGEDAIRLANQANGYLDPDERADRYGLPPGRSRRR